MERKQFTFYRSFYDAIQRMRTKKDKADAYDILCNYALNGVKPDFEKIPPHIATAFEFAKPVLDTAAKRASKMKLKMAEAIYKAAANGHPIEE